MPSDWDITEAEGETYASILEYFEQHPDLRCIPLLIKSVSKETGLGMYEHIKFVLMGHGKAEVLPHLREGILHGSPGVKYRCCWWATDVDAWELADIIRPLAESDDEDVRDAAAAFLELRDEIG